MAGLVLVTGGSGSIGGWCVAELLRRGYEVRTTCGIRAGSRVWSTPYHPWPIRRAG
jgi:nucleoside-diphosphate-sugar epimerase